MLRSILYTFLITAGWALDAAPQSADSISFEARELETVTVSAAKSRKLMKRGENGELNIDARYLSEQVSFLGGNDPLAIVRTLPSVSTTNDLQASSSVRGGSTGDNLFESDGARIVNPLHMLGLFSAFNPSFYRNYTFSPGRIRAVTPSLTSAYFTADSGTVPDSIFGGSASVGLIESHAVFRIPFGKRNSLAVGGRQTYLNLLFPEILKLGDSYLKYNFTDLNAAFLSDMGRNGLLRLSVFADADRLKIASDKFGNKYGDLGWKNLAASAIWSRNDVVVSLAFSGYSNSFRMAESGRMIDLLSHLTQTTASFRMPLRNFTLESDVNYRHSSGQNGFGGGDSWEYNAAADYRVTLAGSLTLSAGLRLALYGCGTYTKFIPQPRAEVDFAFGNGFGVYGALSRRARFDRLVEETTAGLPADFWTFAGASVKPEDVILAEAGVRGMIPGILVSFNIDSYYRSVRHAGEYVGSLLDLTSPDYNPLEDLLDGTGYSAGLSVSASRQFGNLRGRVNYNLGVSRLRFDRYGDGFFPSAHDRPHDLNISLNWNPISSLTISGCFTHATGTPYTRAKLGYMIGENLICEYYPHNSSRLPDYNRLDLAVAWRFSSGSVSHTLTASVYNALATENVLFRYQSYSVSEGIQQRESIMKAVIPSLSYSIDF